MMPDNTPLTKEEQESLTDYERGYIAAMWEFGTWKDGELHIGALQRPIHQMVRGFLKDHRSQAPKGVRRLWFAGHSDDVFGCASEKGPVEELGAWGRVAAYRVSSESTGESLVVTGAYGVKGFAHMCWTIGVSNVDEGEKLPNWPMRYETHDNGYSPVLIIDAPLDAVVKPWDAERE